MELQMLMSCTFSPCLSYICFSYRSLSYLALKVRRKTKLVSLEYPNTLDKHLMALIACSMNNAGTSNRGCVIELESTVKRNSFCTRSYISLIFLDYIWIQSLLAVEIRSILRIELFAFSGNFCCLCWYVIHCRV